MLRRIVYNNAPTGIDNRTLSPQQSFNRPLDLSAMALIRRLVRAHLDLSGPFIGNLVTGVGDIFGDIHDHRARSASEPQYNKPWQ